MELHFDCLCCRYRANSETSTHTRAYNRGTRDTNYTLQRLAALKSLRNTCFELVAVCLVQSVPLFGAHQLRQLGAHALVQVLDDERQKHVDIGAFVTVHRLKPNSETYATFTCIFCSKFIVQSKR